LRADGSHDLIQRQIRLLGNQRSKEIDHGGANLVRPLLLNPVTATC